MKVENVKKTIVVTGGGSGGHTIPSLVMIKFWIDKNLADIYYVGSRNGVERQVVSPYVQKYYVISTGKLRRYFSVENILDFFRFIFGIFQSFVILARLQPNAVFSTGGFVALPVVIAAKLLGRRVVIHEQTTHVGLANKLSSYFADAVCISFKSSAQYFPALKTIFTGYPLRAEFYSPIKKLDVFQERTLHPHKKVLLILGGGNGSVLLNKFVNNNFHFLCDKFQVILQAGKAYEEQFQNLRHENFWVFSFLEKEMVSLLYVADYVIARAGAGTVCELIHLRKKCLFVPLAIAQKNEQWHNAQEARRAVGAEVITEAEWLNLTADQIILKLESLSLKDINDHENVNTVSAVDLIHAQVFKA